MKTQISHLRSGKQNQVLNKNVDYSLLPQATSHVGHSGTNSTVVKECFDKVIEENPKVLNIEILGYEFSLTAYYSVSGNLKGYSCTITDEVLRDISNITPSKTMNPKISIYDGNLIEITNGKNSYKHICPSLITIK